MRLPLEAIAVIGLLFLLIAPALQYSSLPEKIPTHFGASGKPDAWRARSHIWTLPAVGVLTFGMITALTGYAARKEAREAPPERAEQRADLTRTLMAAMKAHTVCVFGFIAQRSIDVALGQAEGLGPWFFVLVGLLVPIFALYFARRSQLT